MKNFFYTEVTSPLDQFEIRNLLSLDGLLYNFCILLSLIIIIVIIARTFGQGFELIKSLVQIFFSNFTLAKFLAAFTTIVSLALVKYYLTGGFTINPKDIVTNVSLGFLGWGANIGITSWFTDFLGIKGINFNLRELLYGYDKMADGSASPLKSTRPIDDLTCHMDIDDEGLDKSKGKGKEKATDEGGSGSTTPKAPTPLTPEYLKSIGYDWSKGIDPALLLTKPTNPGPGFNLPGGEVARDAPIRRFFRTSKFITHIKEMSLEVATEQRENTAGEINNTLGRINSAQEILSRMPQNPTDRTQLQVRNQVVQDIESFKQHGQRMEARLALLDKRLEFINIKINEKKA
jgi:hypothetical protein